MRKLLIALVAVTATPALLGQGTIIFNNRNVAAGIDAKILGPSGAGLSGPDWKADLVAGPAGTPLARLVPVPNSTTPFRTGVAAGYVTPITVTIPNIGPGARATVAVRVFNGSSGLSSYGTSSPITVPTGDPTTSPPGLPTDMIGLTGFAFLCPEPPTYALAILAAVALLLWRRK
ncbi:MAG: hypothetical protein HYY23_18775 [Verrucomicrobia bacterium]|nr:hypothetical protein [Verrucomicrobiota bacterium]